MNLAFVRKGPRLGRRISIGIDLRARGIARRLAEQRGVEQARIVHAAWLARASSRPPDLWYAEAQRQAAEVIEREKVRMRELSRELVEEQRQLPCETAETGPRVYRPARLPRMGRSTLPGPGEVGGPAPLKAGGGAEVERLQIVGVQQNQRTAAKRMANIHHVDTRRYIGSNA